MSGNLAESASPRTAGDSLSIPIPVVVAGFTVLAFVLRSSTFFHSVENWDESQFLLVARSLLDGHAPYTEIFERKPPGIFVLFAAAQLVFGRTVAAIRILGCLAVAASAVLLFLIGRSLKNPTAGLLAGMLYTIFSLTYGRSTSLELCFTPFVLFAFYLVLSRDAEEMLGGVSLPLTLGFVAGAALQISYLVVFDLSALGLFFLVSLPPSVRARRARLFRFLGLVAVGPIAFFAAAVLSFAAAGHFAEYLDANFGANLRYVAGSRVDYGRLAWMISRRVRESFPLWFALVLAPFYLAFFRGLDSGTRRGLLAGFLWSCFAFPGICATGYLFAHYFLELLPAQCLVCALVVTATIGVVEGVSVVRSFLLIVLILLGPVLRALESPLTQTAQTIRHRYVAGIANWGDAPAAVADYLRPRLSESDYLYVSDYHPILYYLLPARIPTMYPMPPQLADEKWRNRTGVDPDEEVRSIFRKRPLYVVKAEKGANSFYRILDEELDRSYQLEKTIGGVAIYRRKDDRSVEPRGGAQ
jgi:4-amino-4-deoxy-L-arabinose transferase-like glycosyltransferase